MEANFLHALAEPNRLRIVELLRDRPRSVNEIALTLQLSQPQVSKHLKYLATSGAVTMKPAAQQRIYALNPEPFLRLDEWLTSFERYWDTKLSNLDRYIGQVKKG